jgi:hypothetical protein
MAATSRDQYVPLPTDLIFCTASRANVDPDARGRCACGLLGIYPEGRPRPSIRTETLTRLHEEGPTHGTRRQPMNLRQLRAAGR